MLDWRVGVSVSWTRHNAASTDISGSGPVNATVSVGAIARIVSIRPPDSLNAFRSSHVEVPAHSVGLPSNATPASIARLIARVHRNLSPTQPDRIDASPGCGC
jgi:hypothetical protein